MDVNASIAVELLSYTTASSSDDTRRVAFVYHNERIVLIGKITDLVHRSYVTIHGEDPIGDDDAEACGLCLLEYTLEILHVGILIAIALSLT